MAVKYSYATFTVRLSAQRAQETRVAWHTQNGSAISGTDYEASSGIVLFAVGETVKQVNVKVLNQQPNQPDKNFFLILEPPLGVTLQANSIEAVIHVGFSADFSTQPNPNATTPSQWLRGPAMPGPDTGENGDFFLNIVTYDIYGPKTSEGWGGIIGNLKGANGFPNTLTIGSVAATAPGATPTVVITGTAPDQTISFTFPRGNTGDVTPAAQIAADTATAAAANALAYRNTVANGAFVYPSVYATALPRGVVSGTVTYPGSGGTNGVFPLAFATNGSIVGMEGTFSVSGGVLTAITITNPGLGSGTTAPTLLTGSSFAACPGLTGALGTLALGVLVPAQKTYWALSPDATLFQLYKNDGTSTPAVVPFATLASTRSLGARNQLRGIIDEEGTVGPISPQDLLTAAVYSFNWSKALGYQLGRDSNSYSDGTMSMTATAGVLTLRTNAVSGIFWMGATLNAPVRPGRTVTIQGVATFSGGAPYSFQSGLALGISSLAPLGGASAANVAVLPADFVGIEAQGGNNLLAFLRDGTTAAPGVTVTKTGSFAWTSGQALELKITFGNPATTATGTFAVNGTVTGTFTIAGLAGAGYLYAGWRFSPSAASDTGVINSLTVADADAPLVPFRLVKTPLPAGAAVTLDQLIVNGIPTLAAGLPAVASASAVPQVTTRNPTATDDLFAGYAVWPAANSSWFNIVTNKLFRCLRSTNGKAIWQEQTSTTALCDAVASPSAAYGTIKIVSAYSGPCFDVKRLSDNAVLTVGWVLSGTRYVVDAAAADAFVGTAIGVISKLYDQSGNGNHIVTSTNPPRWIVPVAGLSWTQNNINGVRTITFDTNGSQPQRLPLPGSLSLDRANYSAVMGIWPTQPAEAATCYLVNGTDASFLNNSLIRSDNAAKLAVTANVFPSFFQTDAEPKMMAFVSGAGGTTMVSNEDSMAGAALGALTMTGGAFGYYNSYQFTGELACLAFYPRAITTTELGAAKTALYPILKVTTQVKDRLIVIGDSIGAGADSNSAMPLSRQLRAYLTRPMRIFNMGASGQLASWFDTNFATNTAPLFTSPGRHILVVQPGTNDIAGGATASAVYTSRTSINVKGKALANCWATIDVTLLPRSNTPLAGGGPAQETVRLAHNSLALANSAGFDAVIDAGANAVMGPYTACADASLYVGALHPTALGQFNLVPDYASPINTWAGG